MKNLYKLSFLSQNIFLINSGNDLQSIPSPPLSNNTSYPKNLDRIYNNLAMNGYSPNSQQLYDFLKCIRLIYTLYITNPS